MLDRLKVPRPLLILLIVVVAAVPAFAVDPSPLAVHSGDDPGRPGIVATLPADLASAMKQGEVSADRAGVYLRLLRIDPATGTEGPPVFGSYRLDGPTLRFEPEFRLGSGAKYRATLSLPGQPPKTVDYEPVIDANADRTLPAVDRVYPSGDSLPANLLKFYVHFSRPMRQTDRIFDQMHLLDEKGEPVHDPWRRFPQWSEDGKRLTLWIHPGRIKRGVNLREELGPVLVAGGRYRLRIDETVGDLSGRPLGRPFEKAFTATAEDHDLVSPGAWKLDTPKARTRDALTVTFTKPLDHALLHRLLTVNDAAGRAIAGTVEVGPGEATWRFRPTKPWTASDHTLVADNLLEDLAGNTPARVFDTDMQAAKPAAQPAEGAAAAFRPQ